jgi:hypothetical protein
LAMQAQNATELGNLGFCSLKRQLETLKTLLCWRSEM